MVQKNRASLCSERVVDTGVRSVGIYRDVSLTDKHNHGETLLGGHFARDSYASRVIRVLPPRVKRNP